MGKPLFSLLLLAACATAPKGSGTAERSAKDYAPFALGASWTYAVNYLGQKAEQTITIVKEEEGYFVDDQPGPAQGRFRHTAEGLRDPTRFLIRLPLEEGNEWKAIVSASAIEHYRIIGVGQPCESQAGRFQDCLIIESRLRRDEKMTLFARWSWARGIGLVKIETEAEIKGKGRIPQTERSLVHYSLNGRSATDDGPDSWSK